MRTLVYNELTEEMASDIVQLRAQLAQQQGVLDGLNKTREQWAKVDADYCAKNNSAAANFHLIRDAQRDIERLHRALAAAPAPVCKECGKSEQCFDCAVAGVPVQAEPASPWVAVTERLPKKGEDVQVYCETNGEQMVAFSLGDGRFQFAVDFYGDAIVCRPTHWSPLPPAPEVKP